MTAFKTLDDLEADGKSVLLRVDFNVPLRAGAVTDATRIERSLPSIKELAGRGARVVLMSHLGRPKGARVPGFSLAPLVAPLTERLPGRRVVFAADCVGAEAAAVVAGLGPGEVALLENLRFHPGEEANDADFAAALARLGDLYVNDAFAAAHRAHASVVALAGLLPAAAGRLMQAELDSLGAALERPARPLVALVGGAKISTKLELLGNLLAKVDVLVVGGAMANTFLHARGFDVGDSLCERDMAETARDLLARAEAAGCALVLPVDVVIAERLASNVATATVPVETVPPGRMILDVGPATAELICARLAASRTLVWNGPLGCFETPPFDAGTKRVAVEAAALTRAGKLFSVAGGGDTLAALVQAGVADDFSYLSTAGGAFLEWLQGRTLPGVAALEAAAAR
ncbi:MAG: phosphoglycerate kinase [Alphaproteobacteria bacterium]